MVSLALDVDNTDLSMLIAEKHRVLQCGVEFKLARVARST
jgi:hypothetical protein